MANIKDITTMCKAGQVQEAYELAKTDLAARPADIWAQRAVGWVLYYSKIQIFCTHLCTRHKKPFPILPPVGWFCFALFSLSFFFFRQ